ncbi:site-2 protease family protein [Clostridium butyricum]|uniref:Peptidase n=1 Tax=Clostridium butyricum TaxID=1492 RepID=A0A2S7F7I9_CLOBU|nr:site-2 protease family protein [Clostridium butyricum]KHD15652.1 peptidase [Clostridium butyricum]PPV12708.1 peptidase [Clostridium butyricum]
MGFLLDKILTLPAILLAFTFHEYAHALVADKLGDKTARFQGRLTLNPAKHIDPFGFLCVLLLGIGYARPVQVNPGAFKNYYKDDLKVSLAGPLANFLVAIVAALIFAIYIKFLYRFMPRDLAQILYLMLLYTVSINISLGIFNLLPIPSFDGFSLVRDIKPGKFRNFEDACYRYQGLLIMVALLFGWRVISPITYILKNLIMNFALSII